MKNINFIECTLRDGGYHNSWDFDRSLVEDYLSVCKDLEIKNIELGFRFPNSNEWLDLLYIPNNVNFDINIVQEISYSINNGDTIYTSGSVTVSVDSNITAFSLPIGWSNTFTQNRLLKEIRDAIFADPANEQLMNLTLEVSDLPAQANGQQTLQVKQSIGGTEGNVAVSSSITNITLQGSTGGSSSQNTFDGGLNDGLDDLALDGFKYSHAEMLESDLNSGGIIDFWRFNDDLFCFI